MSAGARAQHVQLVEGEADGGLQLQARALANAVVFELRDDAGLRVIAHTDLTHYRAPHSTGDTFVLLGILTVVGAPLGEHRQDQRGSHTAHHEAVLSSA